MTVLYNPASNPTSPPRSKLAPRARHQSSSVATRYSADTSQARAAVMKAVQHEAPPAPTFSAQTWLGVPWVAALLDIEMDTQAPDAENGLAKALRFGHTFTCHKGVNEPRHIRRLQSEPTEPPKTALNGKNTNLNG